MIFGKFFRTSALLLAILNASGIASATSITGDDSGSDWSTDLSTYTSGEIEYSFTNSVEGEIFALFTDSDSNGSSYSLSGGIAVTLNNSTATEILGIYSDNTAAITSSSPIAITLENSSSVDGNVGGIAISGGGELSTGTISISISSESSANNYLMGLYGANDVTANTGDITISLNDSSSNLAGMAGVILINGAQAEIGAVSIQLVNSSIGDSTSSSTSTSTNFYGIYTGIDTSYALETGLSGNNANITATSVSFSVSSSSFVNGNAYGAFASSGTSIQIGNAIELKIASISSISGEAYGIYATGKGSVSSGSVELILSGTSAVNESLYGVAAVSEGVVKTGDVSLNIQGGNVVSNSASTTDTTANVYGIFVSAEGSSVTANDVSISVSQESALEAALFGIRATNQGTANVGNVIISIENSSAGANASSASEVVGISSMDEGTSVSAESVSIQLTGNTYLNSNLYGVRSSNGALVTTTGDVYLVIQNSSVGAAVYGVYSSELGEANTGDVTVSLTGSATSDGGNNTSIGGNIYGANVLGTSTLGDVTVKGTDFSAEASVYTIYDTGTLGQASEFQASDVFMRLTGATVGGSIVGFYTDATASGSYSVQNIEMEILDSTLTGIGNIFGHATYATSETSETTYFMSANIASVSLTVTDTGSSDNPVGDVVAIYKQDAGELNVNGTTGLWITEAVTNGVAGAVIANGSANLQNVTLSLNNVASTYGAAGLWIGQTPDSGSQTVDSIAVTVDGNINVAFLSSDSQTSALTQNLYGVVISSGSTGTLTLTGDLNVSLVGDASMIQGDSQTIFGSAVAGTDSSFTICGGRNLYFGSAVSNQNYSFTSSAQNPLLASFANFDSVIVRSGSSLYITTAQNGSLNSESAVFGESSTSLNSSYLDGIVSQGGTMELPANTTLLVDSNATADIHEIINSGTITVYESGNLVVHQGSNVSTMTGQGIITISDEVPTSSISVASLSLATASTATSNETFNNSGTINPEYLVIDGGNLQNTGTVSTNNLTISSGTVSTKEGDFTALGNAYLTGGALYVGEGDTAGQAEINPSVEVNSAVYVVDGILSFGASSGLGLTNHFVKQAIRLTKPDTSDIFPCICQLH